MSLVHIRSAAFPGVFLRLDGRGITRASDQGAGIVNCQFGAGPYETFQRIDNPDGSVSFMSNEFPNVFLRLDGSAVTRQADKGSGVVNAQFTAGPYEKFRITTNADGTQSIQSATIPHAYLRLDGSNVNAPVAAGAGTVNAQFSIGPWERFVISSTIYPSVTAFQQRGAHGLQFMAVDQAGQIRSASQATAGGAWSTWEPGGFKGANFSAVELAAADQNNGAALLFCLDTGGQVWNIPVAANGEWGRWAGPGLGRQPGKFNRIVAAKQSGNRGAELWAVDGDGKIWTIYQVTPGGAWSAWEGPGFKGQSIVAAEIAAAQQNNGNVALFGLDRGGKVWTISQLSPGGDWGRWATPGSRAQPQPLSRIVAVEQRGSRGVELWGIDGTGKIWTVYQLTAGGAWSDWEGAGFKDQTTPAVSMAVACQASGNAMLFSVAKDGTIKTIQQGSPGGDWQRWTAWGAMPPDSGVSNTVFPVCMSGTACTRDEGERTRDNSDLRIYCKDTGYIPVRLHREISGTLDAVTPSVTVRGVGENDWNSPRDSSEPLKLDGPLNAPQALRDYVKSYSGGDQRSRGSEVAGWAATALALHAANLAAASGAKQINFIAHSRGAVEAIMAAWFIYAYGPRDIVVNIFAIDPVPGTGQWYGILTQLAPNVRNYVGIYSWDQCIQPGDKPFMAVIPRPNLRMLGRSSGDEAVQLGGTWDTLADQYQQNDPLKSGSALQTQGYELYACRGRHSTVAGNSTADGQYSPDNVSDYVAPVPKLVYKLARAYLTTWGGAFQSPSAVDTSAQDLRRAIHTDPSKLDAMGGGATRTSSIAWRPYVRRVSSIPGRISTDSYYMDNVVGDPPYRLAYPVTNERTDTGCVKWKFL